MTLGMELPPLGTSFARAAQFCPSQQGQAGWGVLGLVN